MRRLYVSCLVACLMAGLLVGCPKEPNPLGEFRNDSVLRVSINRVLEEGSFALSKFGTAVVTPVEGMELWVAPAAQRTFDGRVADVQWLEATVLYEMGPTWGYQTLEEIYDGGSGRNDNSVVSTPTFESTMSGLALVMAVANLFDSPDMVEFVPYWTTQAVQYWNQFSPVLVAPGCRYYGYGYCDGYYWKSRATIADGKWLALDPPPTECDRVTVTAKFRAELGRSSEGLIVSFLVQIDSDGDGWPNWLERDEGSDPYDPSSVPEEPVETIEVPDLTGLNWAQAEALVEPLGLSIPDEGVTTEASSTVPAGVIIRWSPTGTVPVGTAISIVVSTGPAIVTVSVPDLSGMTESQARSAITAVGLTVGTVSTDSSSTIPSGKVISWSPTGTVPAGTAVSIVVSTGPVLPPDQLGVKISSPVEGQVYHVGDSVPVTATIGGDLAHAPFKVVLSCAGKKKNLTGPEVEKMVREKALNTFVVENAQLGVPYTHVFELTLPGSAWFNAYVEQSDGSYATDGVAYTVVSP